MHILSKRPQHEEEKDDQLMQEVEGTHKKKKLGEATAMAISNPPSADDAVQRPAQVIVTSD